MGIETGGKKRNKNPQAEKRKQIKKNVVRKKQVELDLKLWIRWWG